MLSFLSIVRQQPLICAFLTVITKSRFRRSLSLCLWGSLYCCVTIPNIFVSDYNRVTGSVFQGNSSGPIRTDSQNPGPAPQSPARSQPPTPPWRASPKGLVKGRGKTRPGPGTPAKGLEECWSWGEIRWRGSPQRRTTARPSVWRPTSWRRALPLRPCKPRTSLGLHEARTAITVARQSSVCRKEPDPRPATDSIPDHHSYSNPHHATAATPLANTCSASLDYPCGEAPSQEPSSSEPDSPQQFHNGYPALPPSRSPPPPEEQLVNAQYIPAQPFRATTTRASAHSHKGPKPSRGTYYPERGSQQQPAPQQLQQAKSRAAAKKCRFKMERPGGSKKPGRRACRSQSENSLNGQRGVPERKYNTVERDGGGSGSSRGSQSKGKRPQPGSAGYRRWRSTLDLSQDEAELPPQPTPMPPADHGSRRIRKPRPPPYTYYLDRDRTYLCRPEEGYTHPGQGESESSLSEADTPASSSLSSDSDESGGLVWPQQLPPQLSSPTLPSAPAGAPLQPKAFVKIKASHALKKKILRFRTGSLKIMTTV
ncbi:unnamed protein product [Oncorhynchus mykiss]|uniref:Uncharacterized protein n=1 Tax=Oncorhynchus mykiss TaxID=8022 RepID=A0A060YJU5_ONCMY|nr:unnamed protein product [Oncorhynchus mykiss]